MKDGMTRVQRVLRDLRSVGSFGWCAWRWYVEARPNDRNAPSEINDLPGFLVRSETCHKRDHPEGQTYARHYLISDPERAPKQMEMIAS